MIGAPIIGGIASIYAVYLMFAKSIMSGVIVFIVTSAIVGIAELLAKGVLLVGGLISSIGSD